ncbi:MAG: HlyD family secretion protein [Pseudomonadota bacterium]
MFLAVSIAVFYVIFCWLVFFKFKWIKFSMGWGIVSFWVGLHFFIVFIVALRFFQPYSVDARLVRHTIQLVPRLPEPTLLTDVLVEADTPVKKGQPLFRFDDSLYRARVDEQAATLAAAKQNVLILEADVKAAEGAVAEASANLAFAEIQKERYEDLVGKGGGRGEDLARWTYEVTSRTAQVAEANANLQKAQLAYSSEIDGVNTTVAQATAKLAQAQYYLTQTTLYAPEDGFLTNLQARPGLVVGDRRIGALASWIGDADPYLLATFRQARLNFVEPGQPVEVALDLYPGHIFEGVVEEIWWASGQGQFKPSGDVPTFRFDHIPGRFAVQITVTDMAGVNLPLGAHGAVAIYTGQGKAFEPLRRIGIRLYSWANWVLPLDFL